MRIRFRLFLGSSAIDGSSINMISGVMDRIVAIETSFFSPPDIL